MRNIKLVKRIISGLTACVIALCLAVPLSNVFAYAVPSDPDLCQQSIRLYPDENNTDKTVSLKGLMPENAKAEAVDVTDDHSDDTLSDNNDRVLAAYDITIMNGRKEYQPGSRNPIFVEIKDPAITDKSKIELWHVKDNGDREQITDLVVSEGKISFYATGFSVYEIVSDGNSVSAGWLKLSSIADIVSNNNNGIYISSSVKDSGNGNRYHFISDTTINNAGGTNGRSGIRKTKGAYVVVNGTELEECGAVSDDYKAAAYYFEDLTVSENGKSATCYIYCLDADGETKRYVNNNEKSLGFGAKTLFLVTLDNDGFIIKNNTANYYWNEQGGASWSGSTNGKNQSFAAWETGTKLYLYSNIPLKDNAYQLDGKTFGIMNYEGGSVGNALMANETKTFEKLAQLVSRNKDDASDIKMLYVSDDSDITEWTFSIVNKNFYTISATVNGAVKYLKSDGTSLSLVNDSDDATAFKYSPKDNTDGSFTLSDNGKYLSFDQTNGFTMSAEASVLYFVKKTKLNNTDSITYTANRISVSDGEQACDGKEVIVYTRIWDDVNKKYNFYAIDHDGSLMPCYATGDKLMWLDDATNSLMWKLTVYTDNKGKETGYYELQNTYSGKFIAPQLTGGQILSNKKIGIQLPGRKYELASDGVSYNYGEYYSSIIAWDKRYYDYAAVKGVIQDQENNEGVITSSVYAQADSFYFAILESVDTTENKSALHEVETVDNYTYGINMRLIDFDYYREGNNNQSVITRDYFGGVDSIGEHKGLLSTNLDEDGHPHVAFKNLDTDFGDAFNNSVPVNHIFIKAVHDSSGYFEYDSCQNFATIKGGKDGNGNYNGTEKTYQRTYKDEDNEEQTETVNNFTVFKELGTTDTSDRTTLKHGQFLPYNYIKPGVYSQKNGENLYSVFARFGAGNERIGVLSDDDPRKYEKLHVVTGETDYYLGMEMDAKFVQTPSGLDTWGHDVIFEFTGDDDFWLYVDNELIIDLGGTHSAEAGKVNFRTGEVVYDKDNGDNKVNTTLRQLFIDHYIERGDTQQQAEDKAEEKFVKKTVEITNADGTTENKECYVFKDYSEHKMKIYYMERGAGASNLHMKFNLSSVTPGNVLFAKKLSSHEGHESDLDDMDYNLVQYPFQIMYKYTDNEEEQWRLLDNKNDQDQPSVSYQNSTQTVKFESSYTPPNYPNDREPYQNVFFLIPNKNIEISFPDNAMYYKIVECAVNTDNYDQVSINGNAVIGTEVSGNIKDLISNAAKVSEQPTITFDNRVSEGNIRTLNITKKLYDGNGKGAENELYYINADPDKVDKTRFDIRLYLSNGTSDELKLADLCRYYVLDPNKHLCIWDADSQVFISTDTLASDVTTLSDADKAKVTFHSSRYGAISNIPAGYTVRVPGLPAGTKFMVEERDYEIPTGYDLIDYDCKTDSNGTSTYYVEKSYYYDGKTYDLAETDKTYNSVGTIRAGYDAEMLLNNRRGYGLEVEKKWSDYDFTSSHGPVYTAVYIDDTLVDGSIRQITSDNTSVIYFFEHLEENKTLSDYVIKEVELTDPVVNSSGVVTSYSLIRPLNENQTINVSVTDNDGNVSTQTYTAKYTEGTEKKTAEALDENNIRKDLISNIRKGGITIDLYKWNTSAEKDVALEGGTFVLTCDGNNAGTFVSDETGSVTVLYDFQTDKQYVLTETIAPVGYTGLLEPIRFTITEDNGKYSITTWSNDNDTDDDTDNSDGKFWVEYKNDPGYGIAAKIDVYNRPYTLRAVKVNKRNNDPINDVVFSLHRTITLYGEKVKDFNPLLGYDSLKSGDGVDDGVIPKIDNTLEPDTYYLAEQEAPDDFAELDSDVKFTVSKLGVVTLDSESNNVRLDVNAENNEYVLTIANVPLAGTAELTITKTVSGSLGDRSKQFTFTLTVEGADESDKFEWSKNGTAQTTALVSGGEFTLSHGESVTITLPAGADITLTESNENYTTSFKLDDEDAVETDSYEFELEGDSVLSVTNSLNGIVPTGISVSDTVSIALISVLLGTWFMLRFLRNKKQEQN